jgi:hypothetical protein
VDSRNIFRPDGKHAIAVLAMIAAVFAFAAGEFVIGAVCFVAAAILSLGGLFWNAHRADKEEAAEAKALRATVPPSPKADIEPNKE